MSPDDTAPRLGESTMRWADRAILALRAENEQLRGRVEALEIWNGCQATELAARADAIWRGRNDAIEAIERDIERCNGNGEWWRRDYAKYIDGLQRAIELIQGLAAAPGGAA